MGFFWSRHSLRWMAEEKSDTHYNFNYLIPCTWELSVFSTAFTMRGAVHGIHWSNKTNTLCTFHYSVTRRDSLTQTLLGTPSSWCSTMSCLWTSHHSPITQKETGEHTIGRTIHVLPTLLMENEDWEWSTDLLSLRAEVEKNSPALGSPCYLALRIYLVSEEV